MHYTVHLDDSNPVAKRIVSLLKELSRDNEFVTILPSDSNVEENIVNELKSRYEYVEQNPDEGDSWEVVKRRLLSE